MLEGLDEINWSALSHAGGSAADVPERLLALASADEAAAARAMSGLFATIWREGEVYDATAAAVPFLVELAGVPAAPQQRRLFDLLGAIGESGPNVAGVLSDQGHYAAVRSAVRAGMPEYLDWLHSDDPSMRVAAGHLLSCLSEDGERIVPSLAGRIQDEEDLRVLASLILGLGRLGSDDPEHTAWCMQLVHSGLPYFVRLAAAITMARLAGNETPAEVVHFIATTIAYAGMEMELVREVPWCGWEDTHFLHTVLCGIGPAALEVAGPVLIAALGRPSEDKATLELALTLLTLAFTSRYTDELRAVTVHNAEQREVLAALAHCTLWEADPSSVDLLQQMLRAFGLPETPETLDPVSGVDAGMQACKPFGPL